MSAIQLIGLGAVLGRISGLSGLVANNAGNGIMKAAYAVETSAKEFSPHGSGHPYSTGNLRRSITARQTGPMKAIVETNERYAIYPETGTGRGWTRIGEVAYMRNALRVNEQKIREIVGGEVRLVLR